mmetsp:Transcript_60644/g.133269  ORF Transcript_60644/g.133269 Transcript_60644/m.133269 type:complete len:307 (-) Transcript_60644:49-969(-)
MLTSRTSMCIALAILAIGPALFVFFSVGANSMFNEGSASRELLHAVVPAPAPAPCPSSLPVPVPEPFLSESCTVKQFGGNPNNGYGRWWLCTEGLSHASLVYSFGVGCDTSFEQDLALSFGKIKVRLFDPTITKERFRGCSAKNSRFSELSALDLERRFIFKPYGLGYENGVIPFYRSLTYGVGSMVTDPGVRGYENISSLRAPVFEVGMMMKMHDDSRVDVLKLDVEGLEFHLFSGEKGRLSWLATHPPDQICIEFHNRWFKDGDAKRAKTVKLLELCGYRQRYASDTDEEVLFVRVAMPTKDCG